jgi:two-component system, OmpR family, KDP operon response regulator KdpE
MSKRAPPPRIHGPPAGRRHVLIVARDTRARGRLAATLLDGGVESLQIGWTRLGARGAQPAVVLLDAQSALDVPPLVAKLRQWTSAPVVAVLARGEPADPTTSLAGSADEYLERPIASRELLARIRVWLRRKARPRPPPPAGEPRNVRFRIDRERRCLIVDGRDVHITPIECKLLLALAEQPGNAMTEKQIFAAVWGPGAAPRPQYLRAQVRQLRQKIERDPTRPRHLLTEAGGGYRLKFT